MINRITHKGKTYFLKSKINPQPANLEWQSPRPRIICEWVSWTDSQGKVVTVTHPFKNKEGPIPFKSVAKAANHIQNMGI